MTGWRVQARAVLGSFVLDVDLSGGDGVLAVMGPNGSGKTMLLRVIAGAMPAVEADVSVGGRVLERTAAGIRLPIEQRGIGYVPQGYGLFPHLGVLDNVAFGLSVGAAALPRRERRARAEGALSSLGCAELIGRSVRALSGGEQQRVALARALVLRPRLLLLDEPMAALDVGTRRAVRAALAAHLQAFGCPALVVTHDVRDVEALGAAVAVLRAGRVVQTGSLDALRRAPASGFVEELVGG